MQMNNFEQTYAHFLSISWSKGTVAKPMRMLSKFSAFEESFMDPA